MALTPVILTYQELLELYCPNAQRTDQEMCDIAGTIFDQSGNQSVVKIGDIDYNDLNGVQSDKSLSIVFAGAKTAGKILIRIILKKTINLTSYSSNNIASVDLDGGLTDVFTANDFIPSEDAENITIDMVLNSNLQDFSAGNIEVYAVLIDYNTLPYLKNQTLWQGKNIRKYEK